MLLFREMKTGIKLILKVFHFKKNSHLLVKQKKKILRYICLFKITLIIIFALCLRITTKNILTLELLKGHTKHNGNSILRPSEQSYSHTVIKKFILISIDSFITEMYNRMIHKCLSKLKYLNCFS